MRDNSIDILRFIGLSMIILVHVNPPLAIAQLRCFDVPLMLFVSGLTCANKPITNYWKYVKNRTLRLLVPTYLFLTVYLSALWVLQSIFGKSGFVNWQIVYESFLGIGGIGYVWIIRVFLLIMLVTPLLYKINQRIKNDKVLIISVIWGGVILDTLIIWLTNAYVNAQVLKSFILDWIVNIIAYSILFILGIRLRYSSYKQKKFYLITLTIVAVLSLFLYLLTKGLPIRITPTYKYPPQSYYLVYGLFVSCGLWCTRKYWMKFLDNKLFLFIGQNTIWIYLYHIPLLLATIHMPGGWLIRYVIVYPVAVLITYLQNVFVKKNMAKCSFLKYLIG